MRAEYVLVHEGLRNIFLTAAGTEFPAASYQVEELPSSFSAPTTFLGCNFGVACGKL